MMMTTIGSLVRDVDMYVSALRASSFFFSFFFSLVIHFFVNSLISLSLRFSFILSRWAFDVGALGVGGWGWDKGRVGLVFK